MNLHMAFIPWWPWYPSNLPPLADLFAKSINKAESTFVDTEHLLINKFNNIFIISLYSLDTEIVIITAAFLPWKFSIIQEREDRVIAEKSFADIATTSECKMQ